MATATLPLDLEPWAPHHDEPIGFTLTAEGEHAAYLAALAVRESALEREAYLTARGELLAAGFTLTAVSA